MQDATNPVQEPDGFRARAAAGVGGPVPIGWRECTLTRAKEIETLCDWALALGPRADLQTFASAIATHLDAARQAAMGARPNPRSGRRRFRGQAMRERAKSNLDAAEAVLLNIAPARYVLDQLPGLLEHVRCHLVPTDARRQEFERIAQRVGIKGAAGPAAAAAVEVDDAKLEEQRKAIVEQERGKIASITRAASSAALREQIRIHSFRNIVVATTFAMLALAIAVVVIGLNWPRLIPLCFSPEEGGEAIVVCPTAQSAQFPVSQPPDETAVDIDVKTAMTVSPYDLLVVELVGLIAATVAAAATIRKIRGSSERYHLPVAMAALKLPTGAVTAFLGLLLLRGEFVPGLSALDTSAQILAWALVFGYAQQLFTRFVDQQGQTVLNSVRAADMPRSSPDPPAADRVG